ncbi:MAG: MerR family transcriptional regulator [Firmicutes bacterium]|nr:MerR family transcriptional regulator [Bacillota bacterium]
MAELKNCKRCGKLFNYIGGIPICPACKDEEEADFQKIKKYLYENPGASISQVASDLNMGIDKIKKFLREGRLEIIGDDGIPILRCEKCGEPIKTGRFCDECSRSMSTEFSMAANKMKGKKSFQGERPSVGMRYLSVGDKKKEK